MTTLPAPTNAFSPTSTPGSNVLFAPILAPRPTCAPFNISLTKGDRGYLALVMTTFGPIQDSGSNIFYSGMKAFE